MRLVYHLKSLGFWAAALNEGVNDLYFHTYGERSPPPSPPTIHLPLTQILASRPKSQSQGPNPSFGPSYPILSLKLKSHPPGPDPTHEA